VALPLLAGRRVSGLPHDAAGFLPIDEHARVHGVQDVFAAGDGADFPVKQGGIGTQQADAAAEQIAARAGAPLTPQPFRPMLRGCADRRGKTLLRQPDHGRRRTRRHLLTTSRGAPRPRSPAATSARG
jgi:NADPH-dependent 2,4-dienoyl-CoA reductase/sulfur reductase-like enzyme